MVSRYEYQTTIDSENKNVDFGDDDEDDYRCNSVNFQARTSRFCMEVDLDNI